tara:strand:- start:5655 stop:5951 length:297 start_codon:yes stop_codon:yes gene_type:complete
MDLDDEPPPDETISLFVGLDDFNERVYEDFRVGDKIVLRDGYARRVDVGSVGEIMSIMNGERRTRHCWVYFESGVRYGSKQAYFDKNFGVRVGKAESN